LSSFTRNIALGRSSVTMPLNSIISSLDKQTSLNVGNVFVDAGGSDGPR
jgi:hypothetical protein